MNEVYLIATIEKITAGKAKAVKESDREYYIGGGNWTKNPLSARMHKPETLAKTMARATKADMYPGFVCGLVVGEQKFVITNVITPDVLAEMEKKREAEMLEKKKQNALSKLTAEEKAILGIA